MDVPADTSFQTGLPDPTPAKPVAQHFRELEESSYLLLGKSEITWLTDKRPADRQVDVFVSLGCGVQGLPHLMLDTVAVLDALGVPYVAGGGRPYCCGNPLRTADGKTLDAADRLVDASVERMMSWGTQSVVHWCTACQLTFGAWSRGDQSVSSGATAYPLAAPPRAPGAGERFANVYVHEFLARTIRELGDRVPWKRELRMRVLMEGHPELTPIHDSARSSGADLLSLVPGVEVLGFVDPPPLFVRKGGNCTNALTELTPDDVRRIRIELAEQAHARGADTVSCQHHNCHRTWCRFASEGLAVKHPVSVVAEALGVAHPDRYQIAASMGDVEAVVDHTRPLWRTWDIERADATRIAHHLFDPKYATRPSCACGGDPSKCDEGLITLGR